MTEHEKSRKHYEQSGTYDPNMEYFEECEVNSGEQCEENGQDCRECPDLMIKEQEAAGHERHNTDS